MAAHGAGIFARGEVYQKAFSLQHLPRQTLAPEFVQVFAARRAQPGLHLKAVRRHGVQRAQHAVQAGEDAHMPLHVIKISRFEHLRGHVFVLDAVVCQQCRRGRTRELQAGILLKGALCQRV